MKTWIALLRGINVGGKHIVPMKELTKLMESAGFSNVQTYIQSGNLVFQSSTKPKHEIGQLIEKRYGFKPSVFIMSTNDFKKAAAKNPFETDLGKTVHFFFFNQQPEIVDYDLLNSLKAESESYRLQASTFYLHAPDGIGRSKLVEKIAKVFPDVDMTARNLNTINKLLDMVNQ